METIIDVLLHSLAVALAAGEISEEQHAEAVQMVERLRG